MAVASLLAEEAKRKMTQEEKRQFLENELKQYNSSSTVAIDGDRFLAKHREYKIEIDEKYKVSIKEPFNPEVWDKTATPEDAFIWQSDDQNSEEYGVVIGYNEKVENYTTVRFPSRCTEIELLGLYDEEGVYQGTTRGFTNNILKVEIPGTVHTIGTWAFGDPHASSFQALEEIVMEEGVTNIERAFENCSNLRDITIPNTVNYIENVAFLNTAWYNEQPDGVVYAGKVAYKYKGTMPSNTEITLKEDTVGISQDAFSYCTNLRSINIPESVRNIGSYAFSNCGLISITISEGVTNIETSAFSGCTGLSSISFPDSITSIGVSAFKDTAWYDNQSDGLIYIGKVVYKYKGTMPSDTSITLNEDTVGIAGDAFRSCTGLTNINIPESVTNIGESAFNSCTGLTNIIIPESVTTIGGSTFSGCRGLTNIIIPRTVTRIGSYAFGYWEETQTINCIIESKPAGWDSGWDGYSSPSYGYYGYQPAVARKANLVWGYTGQ